MFTQCFLPGLHGDELDRFYRDDDHNNKKGMKCLRHPSHQGCTETNWTPLEVKTAMFTAKSTAWIGTRWVDNQDNDNHTGTKYGTSNII